MNPMIEPIERALAAEASPDTKQAGATACRAILAALEAEPGKPIAMPGVPARPASPLAGLSTDQVFDLMIAKLRTMVDANGKSAPTALPNNAGAPLRIPMIILPPVK
jgi:hypothetical protein